jgi:oligoendopeptidase F
VYRFAIEEVYRLQEHVLDERGEMLLSLSSRLGAAPSESYSALSTADAKFPEVTLSTGETLTMSYGQYRAVLAMNRNQPDRRAAFLAHYGTFQQNLNTYASLYHAASAIGSTLARVGGSTLSWHLHGKPIRQAVILNLIGPRAGRRSRRSSPAPRRR